MTMQIPVDADWQLVHLLEPVCHSAVVDCDHSLEVSKVWEKAGAQVEYFDFLVVFVSATYAVNRQMVAAEGIAVAGYESAQCSHFVCSVG